MLHLDTWRAKSSNPLLSSLLGQSRLFSKKRDDSDAQDSTPEEKTLANEELASDDGDRSKDATTYSNDSLEESPLPIGVVKASAPEFFPEVLAIPVTRRPVFPGFYKTISVKDAKVAHALTQALKKGRPYVGLFLAKPKPNITAEGIEETLEPDDDRDTIGSLDDIHEAGVFAQIINVIPSPSQGVTAIVYPHRRIKAKELLTSPDPAISYVRNENIKDQPFDRKDRTIRAISQEIFAVLADVAKLNAFFREHITHYNVPSSVFEDPSKLADFVAVLSSSDPMELQSLFEETQIEERLRKALLLLKKELVTAQLQQAISKEVEQKLSQKQREYFLHEQLKTIKKELGLETDSKEKLLQLFNDRFSKLTVPDSVRKVYEEEIGKLSVLEPSGAEFNVTRNYLEWITQLPWEKHSDDILDIEASSIVLNKDHYGLEDVKDRILEFIAVAKLKGSISGKILCLVGPPGVGKTSIGRSVARALGREYFRFSIGGLVDVAEIKGHRRTYVGAMPGKIVQALKKVQTANPLILVDEIDKIGRGHQGDPASALLELLDPEQNDSFLDHYLDIPLDLSKVLFMCTANQTDTIPAPLLDRMEIINLSGYVAQEKIEIAKKYLLPQARLSAGISDKQVVIEDSAIETLIKQYCRESGVRNLKKKIEKIFRKAALKLVKSRIETNTATTDEPITVCENNLHDFVGNPIFTSDRLYEGVNLPKGVCTGMAWTAMGGTILYIETILEKSLKSKAGKNVAGLIRTGQLSDVMKESSSIAYSYAKAFVAERFPENTYFDLASLHLHVPDGATPKDGPSAGCTMTSSILSQALNISIPSDIAMTGEITLTGKILRIGGVKEKTIAAKRSGIKILIFPKSNEADWKELPQYIRDGIKVHFVDNYVEIAEILGFT